MSSFDYFYNKVRNEGIIKGSEERSTRNLKREGIKLSSQKV